MSTQKRRRFAESVKRQGVERVISIGLPILRVAEGLGLHETLPRRWMNHFAKPGTGLRGAPSPGRVHHGDRGVQYAADAYRQALAAAGLTPSMGRKGACLDNAPMESFLHTLKVERVHHRVYATRDEARRAVSAAIEGFYTSRRLHSGIAYRSPADSDPKAA